MNFNFDLQSWRQDGAGRVLGLSPGELEVEAQTPFTLWSPSPLPDSFEFAFECSVVTPHSAMLVMACARDWRGGDLLGAPRSGDYAEYNASDLEMYTLGFNRTGQVSNDVQPNASSVNLRRIGGPDFLQYHDLTLAEKNDTMMRKWHDWDSTSLICSVREFASGTDCFFSYRLRSAPPKITWHLEGEELFAANDHRPEALRGGFLALRCMTPGGRFRVRNLSLHPAK